MGKTGDTGNDPPMTEEDEARLREAVRLKCEAMERAGGNWIIMTNDDECWTPEDTEE